MSEHEQDSTPDTVNNEASMAQGRTLVLAAFTEARSSGRPNWNVMTTAVLKNRILDATDRTFKEREYGVSTILEFVHLFPELLSVDSTSKPPLVTLTATESLPELPSSEHEEDTHRRNPRVRPDLWRAIVDYRSENSYVWDTVARIARVADAEDENPELPTLSSSTVARMRVKFAEEVRPTGVAEQILNEWLERNYSNTFLPTPLRGQWAGFFRQEVLERIRRFFDENGLALPEDLLIEDSHPPAKTTNSSVSNDTELTRLRSLVQRCVAVMTKEELSDLRISPSVMVRAINTGA
ncbi:hypothetical protein [Amycolatopsis sp. MEPSY49]|uniref:hypothetical protein n=1 Tax=Amycolatopsis sp. MEPSY49 TaxID=3151600 RepID=UPI003EF2AAC5